jgi:hypothetical protein
MSFQPESSSRFTDIRLIVEEVRRVWCRVKWRNKHRVPKAPNELVYLDDFKMRLPDPQPPIPDRPGSMVDGQLSCRLAYACIERQAENSPLCKTHTRRLRALVEAGLWRVECLVGGLLDDFAFTLPTTLTILSTV